MWLFNFLKNKKQQDISYEDDYFTNNWMQELPKEEYDALVEKHTQNFLNKYDLNSISGIQSIPVPEHKETRVPTSVAYMPEQILSRKATEHKKAGNMELAIACLRKANEFRPVSWFSYQADDYLRLVEFLKQDRQFDEARKEYKLIETMFPHYFNQAHNPKFYETLLKANHSNIDLITVSTTPLCPHCSPYNSVAYSISEESQIFPPLSQMPEFLKMYTCEFCNCVIGHSVVINTHTHTYYSGPQDRRTETQKENFKQIQLEKSKKEIAKLEYDWLWEHLEEHCPKSLSAYTKMKNSNSERFKSIVKYAAEKGFTITII